MKVILLEDVKKLGKKDQIIEVSNGYANNFLIPRHLAVQYTPRSLEILEKQKEDARLLEEQKKEEAIKTAALLEGITVEFKAKTGKDGKMFGTISTKQIEEKLQKEFNITIDKRKFVENYSIDYIGYATLKIELYKGVIGNIKVKIEEEGK